MSIFDMFTAKQPAPAPAPAQQQPTPPGDIQPPVVEATPGQGSVPNADQAAAAPVSPMDQYKDLWEPIANKSNESSDPYAALDPDMVNKAVSKADFSSALTPENLAAVAAGGEDAQKAFVASLNSVAQQVLAQSTLVSNRLMEQRIKSAIDAQAKQIPDMVRQQSLAESHNQSNPTFNNPAIKPIIEATRHQLSQKYPNAGVAELTEMTNNYILEMGKLFNPAAPENAGAPPEVDWDKFLQS